LSAQIAGLVATQGQVCVALQQHAAATAAATVLCQLKLMQLHRVAGQNVRVSIKLVIDVELFSPQDGREQMRLCSSALSGYVPGQQPQHTAHLCDQLATL
jgi:hypothetical protein